ncbi:iron-containing alcohol dehydrogenase [Chakrabartyella piscis]|uniref:iron-containing alcohol dehydrogenase n=1 Tax=Chakrabartyella piscis TaxID=2918914 RepID=UPI002958A90D|nr:iron-containing alcohol dehydrogenase [Chakrabartyella piscis]
MAREFTVPSQMITGVGALTEAVPAMQKLGTKALIVCGKVMTKLGTIAILENVLKEAGIAYAIYNEIVGEPTDVMIVEGVAKYKKENCDFLIAMGGGSPLDAMKAIGALVTNEGELTSYMGIEFPNPIPPTVAIPTTAGTGSEATQFTIITDPINNVKMLLKGKVLIPTLAIVDPQFTLTAPPKTTAATGIDALAHAVEAYTSRKAQPLSDTFALAAIKRIFKYLPIAYKNGSDMEAREQMSLASLEAGIAFNNASVTVVHGMSRPIGALFHVAHGLSNAILLESCMRYVLEGTYERFGTIGRLIGAANTEDSDQVAAEAFLAELVKLCKILEIPTLAEYGIQKEEFFAVVEKMVEDAMKSGSPQNTMKELTKEDLLVIYKGLW